MISTLIRFGNSKIEFSGYDKQRIEEQGNMVIIRGIGCTLTGTKEHDCNCEKCTEPYDEVVEYFTTKELAEKYAEEYDMEDAEIEEESCHYIKAVAQKEIDIGLFKNEA